MRAGLWRRPRKPAKKAKRRGLWRRWQEFPVNADRSDVGLSTNGAAPPWMLTWGGWHPSELEFIGGEDLR